MIYLASPYTHKDAEVVLDRVGAAHRAMSLLILEGLLVYSPIIHGHYIHMSHEASKPPGAPSISYGYWMAHCLDILTRSHAIFILDFPGWNNSTGVLKELSYAQKLDIDAHFLRWEELKKGRVLTEPIHPIKVSEWIASWGLPLQKNDNTAVGRDNVVGAGLFGRGRSKVHLSLAGEGRDRGSAEGDALPGEANRGEPEGDGK